MKLSERVGKIKPSATMAMASRAKQMSAQGIDVVDFSLGEPDFDTPEVAKAAAIQAMKEGYTKYTPPAGADDLKDAIIEKFQRDNGLKYERSEIIVSCGAKHSLYNIAQVLYDRGDEVIIPAPYWVSYPDQTLLNDAVPVIIKTKEEERFLLSPALLERAITPRSKVLILNSPSNPTGSAYDAKTLENIAEIVLKNGLIVVSDEIYEKMLYDRKEHVSIASLGPEIKKQTLIVNGVSKAFSMTGWRIGYIAGAKEIVAALTTVQSQSTSNPTSISQKAAAAALRGGASFTQEMVAEFGRRRDYAADRLNGMKGVSCPRPDGAFYLFPNISRLLTEGRGPSALKNSSDLSNLLLEKARVSTVPGDAFGSDRHIRISYAVPMEILREGLSRIEALVAELPVHQ